MLLKESTEHVKVFVCAFLVGKTDEEGIGKGIGDYMSDFCVFLNPGR